MEGKTTQQCLSFVTLELSGEARLPVSGYALSDEDLNELYRYISIAFSS